MSAYRGRRMRRISQNENTLRGSVIRFHSYCSEFAVIDIKGYDIVCLCLPELLRDGSITTEELEKYKNLSGTFSFGRIYTEMNKFAIGDSTSNLLEYIGISEDEFKDICTTKPRTESKIAEISDLLNYTNNVLRNIHSIGSYVKDIRNPNSVDGISKYITYEKCKFIHNFFSKTYQDLSSIVNYLKDIQENINKVKVNHPDKSVRSILYEFGRFLDEFILGRLETVNMLLHSTYMFVFAPMLKRFHRTGVFEDDFSCAFVQAWILKHIRESIEHKQLRTPIFDESCKWIVNNFLSGRLGIKYVFSLDAQYGSYESVVSDIGDMTYIGKFFFDMRANGRIKKLLQKYSWKCINNVYSNVEFDRILKENVKKDLVFTDPVKIDMKINYWGGKLEANTIADSIGYGSVFNCFIDWLRERNCIMMGIPLTAISYEMTKAISNSRKWYMDTLGKMIRDKKTKMSYKDFVLQTFSINELEKALNDKKDAEMSTVETGTVEMSIAETIPATKVDVSTIPSEMSTVEMTVAETIPATKVDVSTIPVEMSTVETTVAEMSTVEMNSAETIPVETTAETVPVETTE